MNSLIEIYNLVLSNSCGLAVLLIAGFVLLVYGADWLVDGASAVAKRLGVSDLIIGLTVVAFGTSMPEFVVNMISAGQGNCELAITNVLGSNAINIFVILGLTALIWPVTSERQSRNVDIPVACLGALLVFIFALNGTLGGKEGAVLVVVFILYMMYLTHKARTARSLDMSADESAEPMPVWKSILLVVVGLIGLSVGGEMCVDSATAAAHRLGVSDAIIGLTIVALGTSLPELATSVIAAMKHNSDLALGNCVGSCIFNVFFVLAISSCVHPLLGYEGLWLDALMAFAGPALTWIFVMNDKNHEVSRPEGAILLIVYGAYLAYRLLSL